MCQRNFRLDIRKKFSPVGYLGTGTGSPGQGSQHHDRVQEALGQYPVTPQAQGVTPGAVLGRARSYNSAYSIILSSISFSTNVKISLNPLLISFCLGDLE